MSVNHNFLNPDAVLIYKEQQQIVINTGLVPMLGVTVFDSMGRQLFNKAAINATEFKFNSTGTHGLLLLQILTIDHQIITKKLIQ